MEEVCEMFQSGAVISHWYHLFDNAEVSANKFYDDVERAVRMREPPDVSYSRVEHSESGILSAKRTYLRVARRKLVFDICAAPYGKGYFVSWWLASEPAHPLTALLGCFGLIAAPAIIVSVLRGVLDAPLWVVVLSVPVTWWVLGTAIRDGATDLEETVMEMPGIGQVYTFLFRPTTYYRHDNLLAFQETVHRAVMEVVDCLGNEQGLRTLSEAERAPRTADVFR